MEGHGWVGQVVCGDRVASAASAKCHYQLGDRRWNSSADGRKAAGGVVPEHCR